MVQPIFAATVFFGRVITVVPPETTTQAPPPMLWLNGKRASVASEG